MPFCWREGDSMQIMGAVLRDLRAPPVALQARLAQLDGPETLDLLALGGFLVPQQILAQQV